MGNFNKYNERSLSQLLAESKAILEDEFPPGGGAPPEAPPVGGGDVAPDTADIDAGPPGEEGDIEGGAEDTPEGLVNQISDLLDQLRSKLGMGGEEEGGPEDTFASEAPAPEEENMAPAASPPMESRKKKPAPAPAKKLAPATAKK